MSTATNTVPTWLSYAASWMVTMVGGMIKVVFFP
jgi:hypothetical protein